VKKLGFGGMRLPRLVEDDPKSIDQAQVNAMVDYFIEHGFTYFDTAYPYHQGLSEGAFLKAIVDRYPRESFLLADKMPTFSVFKSEDYERIFNEQLERCGVEYFDYYLLHNLGKTNYANSVKFGGFEFIKKLKEEGKAKHIGFSFHDNAELLDEILTKHPEIEFVQLQLNYIDWESESIQSRKCYEVARRHDKKITVMEPIKGGGLANPPEKAQELFKGYHPEMSYASWAIRYVASLEGVMIVLSGMNTIDQLKDNTSYMEDFKPINDEEKSIITKVVDIINESIAVPCTNCQYCVDECPKKINIPSYFSIYNSYHLYGDRNFPAMHYDRQSNGRGKASECIECKLCEGHCPQHIKITEKLKLVAQAFEK